MLNSNFWLGAIIGVMVALIISYYRQIQFVYENRGAINDVSNIVSSGQDLFQKI